MAPRSPRCRAHTKDTRGLSAADFERLRSWMPEIAGAARGLIEPEGRGFRVGVNRALVINADSSFHDFAGSGRDHGYGPLELLQRLYPNEADITERARQWLAAHEGDGRLSGENVEADEEADVQDVYRTASIAAMWESAQPIPGTPAATYLASRGLAPTTEDLEQLRWTPAGRADESAMLAAVRDDAGVLVGLQRTFLSLDGLKSTVAPVRQTLRGPADWNVRGAVRFGSMTGKTMVTITEGVEDGLTARAAGHGPVLAVLGIGRLGRVALPASVTKVLFVRDDDPPDSPPRKAMAHGLVLLMASGRQVLLTKLPSDLVGADAPTLTDINDLWQHDPDKVGELLVTASPPLFHLFPDLVEAALEATSRLSALDYERCRKAVLRMVGLERLSALDKDRVARVAARTKHNEEVGPTVKPQDLPWPDPVTDLGAVLDEAVTEITRYIAAPPEVIIAVVLWCAYAHILQHETLGVDIAARLAIQAASRECGKSRLAELVGCLSPRDLICGSISPAAIYRVVDAVRPTLVIDEGDRFFQSERGQAALGILNSGHSLRTAWVVLMERDEDGKFHPLELRTFTGICFTSIRQLPETLQSRSIALIMRRKTAAEPRERLRKGESPVLFELRRKLVRWSQDTTDLPDVEMDSRLQDRQADNWYWLFRIAAAAGGDWLAMALKAALHADREMTATDRNQTVALLTDLWEVFATKDTSLIETQLLLDALHLLSDGRWQEAGRGGKPITQYWLRDELQMLIPSTSEMQKLRRWSEGNTDKRGYHERHFEDAWARYLGRLTPSATKKAEAAAAKAAEEEYASRGGERPCDGCDVSDGIAEKASNSGHFSPSDAPAGGTANASSAGKASDGQKTAQNVGFEAIPSDQADPSQGKPPHREKSLPRGAVRRVRPNGNGRKGRP